MIPIIILTLGLNYKPYYFDNRIYNFGNIGIKEKIHAELAYLSTKTKI